MTKHQIIQRKVEQSHKFKHTQQTNNMYTIHMLHANAEPILRNNNKTEA